MFEQDYKRANDRIHPRKDLLKELEAQWAAEQAQPAEEEKGKVVNFPCWARYASMAAGILLCVGLGMGSMLLLSRSRGARSQSAEKAPRVAESKAAVQEEAAIVTQHYDLAAGADTGAAPAAVLAASEESAPKGMHPAADEAEVEDALRWAEQPEMSVEAETAQAADADVPAQTAKAAANAVETQYSTGEILVRDDHMAVFMPTTEQVHVVQYANRKVSKVFSLNLQTRGSQPRKVFWMGSQFLAVRERNGDTELLRFDVSDWKAPRFLKGLTQSGATLAALEAQGRIVVLSLYGATEEEPRPWVDGARMDYAQVLLDQEKPGDRFTVVTVLDPEQEGFVAQKALLAAAKGAVVAGDRLLVWIDGSETDLYIFSLADDLALTGEETLSGALLAAAPAGDGFSLLVQEGQDVRLLALDDALTETAAAKGLGPVRQAQVLEDGAYCLTADGLHRLTAAGDRSAAASGDGFCRIAEDRILVLSQAGQLQLVQVGADGLQAQGTLDVHDSLALLVEDPSRLDYDPATGRLAFPAGQKVHLYCIDQEGQFVVRGMPVTFHDHDERDQRELRCRLEEDRILLFYKSGVVVCNNVLEKQITVKY